MQQRFKNLIPGTWFAPECNEEDVLMKLDHVIRTREGEEFNCVNRQVEFLPR